MSHKVGMFPNVNAKKLNFFDIKLTHKHGITMIGSENLSCDETITQAIKKLPIKKIKFALSQNQIDEILSLSYFNSKHNLMIQLQLMTGMRVSEICNIRIEAFNLIEKFVTIENYDEDDYCKEYDTKTKAGHRRITIDEDLQIEIIKAIGRRSRGYLFISPRTKTKYDESSVIRFINKYAVECESIKHTIGSHALRRTYASRLANDGIPIGKISKLLGHKDIKTTMIYLYDIWDDNYDDVRASVAKINRSKKLGNKNGF